MHDADSEDEPVLNGTDEKSGTFAGLLERALAMTNPTAQSRDWATFAASYLGFCPRQSYLIHLSLRDATEWYGKFRARQAIQNIVQDSLTDVHPRLDVSPSVELDIGHVTIVGRPTAYDPDLEIVYHLKPRNGWYKFHPPVERHVNQLHMYMAGCNADHGQLIYLSMGDLTDIRVWPADFQDDQSVAFDPVRAKQLTEKATQIRNEIVCNGIATTGDEIPFDPCGCYLCQTETLDLPGHPNGAGERVDESPPSQSASSVTTASGLDATPLAVETGDTTTVTSDTNHVPTDMRDHQIWVVWDCEQKQPLAPWATGTMYPCRWAEDRDADPRREYPKAKMIAELPVEQVHESWPFPDREALPATIKPAVLLPHNPPTNPFTFVDFDDVRDPETGTIPVEVAVLLDRLGGYAEVSRSGTGLHCWVRGGLPAGQTSYSAPLHQAGHIEVYDHSRFTGGTWAHIEGTPTDRVPNVQNTLKRLVATYTR